MSIHNKDIRLDWMALLKHLFYLALYNTMALRKKGHILSLIIVQYSVQMQVQNLLEVVC